MVRASWDHELKEDSVDSKSERERDDWRIRMLLGRFDVSTVDRDLIDRRYESTFTRRNDGSSGLPSHVSRFQGKNIVVI